MNILFICSQFPYPPLSGPRQRYYALIRHLSQHHRIHVLSIIRSAQEREHVPAMEEYCCGIDTVLLEKKISFKRLRSVLFNTMRGLPLYNSLMTSSELKKKIYRLCREWNIDIVHIEHTYMAHYIHALPPGISCIKILTYNDIASIQNRRIARIEKNIAMKLGYLFNSIMMRFYEVKIGSQFDACIAVSQQEKAFLEGKNPRLPVTYLPNGTDTDFHTPIPLDAAAKDIIFIGTFKYTPNIDAVIYFSRRIFPKIEDALPDTEFWIVGPNPPPAVANLANNPRIRVTGFVEDPVPYYRKAGVAVAPLRAGGGTRLKILVAMALGRPVVSTSIGCEGLDVADGEHILIADTPDAFASSCISALTNHTLKHRIAAAARRVVEERYSWKSITERLQSLYADLGTRKNEKRMRGESSGT